MKKLILIFLLLNCFLEVKSQENKIYFVNASTGLIIREEPSLNSKRIGKLPYGKTVELIENTGIKEQWVEKGAKIKGDWLKIKYDNIPFICSESESDLGEWNLEGYVFSKYSEKLNKAQIEFEELDSVKFFKLYVEPKPQKRIKIESIEETKKKLGAKVKWKDIENIGFVIDEIILENGQKLRINQKSNDYGFVAYYPFEKIILFEGGHTSDFSISLKTGETLKTVGNPEYIIESPNKKLRLNGWFPGQECSSYFFQEKSGNDYSYLVDFGWGSEYGNDLCYYNKFCWLHDNEFIYSFRDYSEDSSTGVEKYIKGRIVKL